MDVSEYLKLKCATGRLKFHVSRKRVSRSEHSGPAQLMLTNTYSDMIKAGIANTVVGMTEVDNLNIDLQAKNFALG